MLTRAAALLAALALPALPGAALAADIPGDPGTRAVLRPGPEGVTGTFERRGDRDWYRVTLRGGRNYAFHVTGDDCSRLSLRSLGGAVLRTTSGSTSFDSGFEIMPARTTTFFVEFRPCPPPFTDLFPFAYSGEVRADARGDAGTAATIGVGQTINGYLNWGSDADFFRTMLQAGTSYTATTANVGSIEFRLGLVDPRGTVLFSVFDFDEIRRTFTVPASGTYFLTVTAAADAGGNPYRLSLTTP
jgi:serralysin